MNRTTPSPKQNDLAPPTHPPYEAPSRTDEPRPGQPSAGPASIGQVLPDGPEAENLTVHVGMTKEGRPHFYRDLYVSMQDAEQGIEFLGRVVGGPFHETQNGEAEESGDGRALTPESYQVTGLVEILGRLEDGERLVPTPRRPRPGASVRAFAGTRLKRLLGVEGDVYLGKLIGADDVTVALRSGDKNFLPRNVGIFGTVGSGKSNTMQVLMEEAVHAGWAVVAIDVEGEYVQMNAPTDDPAMVELLRSEHGLAAEGIEDFHVYVPASGRSKAAAVTRFKVPIAGIDAEILADILAFSDADRRMFEAASRNAASRNEYLGQRAVGQGAPSARSRPGSASRSLPGTPPRGAQAAPPPPLEAAPTQAPYSLQDLIDGLQESNQSVPLIPRIRAEDLPTAASLRAKLIHLGRSNVMDWNGTASVGEIPIDDLIVGGRLSVLDVSEADDRSRNVAIAYVLQELFGRIVETPIGDRMPSGPPRPPLLVVMEEVHTFVSRATAHRMRAVLDNLQIITRRGRKRWMALALVSQQPNHVPDELFELANTRFIHQMKSTSNVRAVKETTGGVAEMLWSTVSTLGPGQCLLTGSGLRNALLLAVRPSRSRRRHTE